MKCEKCRAQIETFTERGNSVYAIIEGTCEVCGYITIKRHRKTKMTRLSLYLPFEQKNEIKLRAVKNNRSFSEQVLSEINNGKD